MKFKSALSIISLSVFLAACGGDDNETTDSENSGSNQVVADDTCMVTSGPLECNAYYQSLGGEKYIVRSFYPNGKLIEYESEENPSGPYDFDKYPAKESEGAWSLTGSDLSYQTSTKLEYYTDVQLNSDGNLSITDGEETLISTPIIKATTDVLVGRFGDDCAGCELEFLANNTGISYLIDPDYGEIPFTWELKEDGSVLITYGIGPGFKNVMFITEVTDTEISYIRYADYGDADNPYFRNSKLKK